MLCGETIAGFKLIKMYQIIQLRTQTVLLLVLVLFITAVSQKKKVEEFPTTYEYSNNASSKNIPFEVDEDGKIYLQVQINGSSKLRFLLDTGAALLCMIDPQVVDSLKLTTKPGYWVVGTGGSTLSGSVAKDISFSLPGLSMQHVNAGVIPMRTMNRPSKYVDGILGFDIFRNFVVEVNYASHTLSLFLPETYVYKGSAEIIPVTFLSDAAYVKAKVTIAELPPIEDRFKLDTGNALAISFHTPFVDKNNLLKKVSIVADGADEGFGGESQAFFAFSDLIQLGSSKIGRSLISFSRAKAGPFSLDNAAGTLGAGFLRSFNVVFDFPHSRLILEPSTSTH